MNFDPEFVEFIQYCLLIFGCMFISFCFGGVLFWILAWSIVGLMDFFTDEIKEFKQRFKSRKRAWRPPEHPPL